MANGERKELQKRIDDLTREIERLTREELREYETKKTPVRDSRNKTVWPLFLFLIGFLGFTIAYFTVGLGSLAYISLFGLGSAGLVWLMLATTRMPRWERWKAKEETVTALNKLYLQKRELVRELRRLDKQKP